MRMQDQVAVQRVFMSDFKTESLRFSSHHQKHSGPKMTDTARVCRLQVRYGQSQDD